MNNVYIVIIITLLFAFTITYSRMLYKLSRSQKELSKMIVNVVVLEEYIKNIEENKIQSDESVHKENFIKFLSDSRDWAYQYIEEVQDGLGKFISEIEPEINYFKEYGDIVSMQPNYYSMKKISQSYDELKKLMPEDPDAKA